MVGVALSVQRIAELNKYALKASSFFFLLVYFSKPDIAGTLQMRHQLKNSLLFICLFIGEICVAHLPVTQISRLFLKSRCDSCEMGDISVQIRPQRVSTCRHKCWLKQFSHLHCSSELFYTFLDWGARGSANVRAEVRSQYRKSTTGCLPSCSLTWAGWRVSSNVTSQNTEPSQTVMWLFKADYFLLFTACEKGKLQSMRARFSWNCPKCLYGNGLNLYFSGRLLEARVVVWQHLFAAAVARSEITSRRRWQAYTQIWQIGGERD